MKSNSSSANSSKSKSFSSHKFEYDENVIIFYNNYKDKLEDILDILYRKLGKPTLSQDLQDNKLFPFDLPKNPIIIEDYSLKCELDINIIKLKNDTIENCYIDIDYFSKIKVKKDDKSNYDLMWVCNNQIAMILVDNKTIYYSKKESLEENDNDYDIDNISIISNLESLEKVIKENKIIYSTKNDIIDINSISEEIDNKNHISNPDLSFFLTGINSVNFQEIIDASKVETLYNIIPLPDAMAYVGKKGFFLYNKNIGMTIRILTTFYTSKKSGLKNYFYININYIKNIASILPKKKYFAYYLQYLFKDSKSFINFYKKIAPLIADRNKNFYDLIFDIIEEFQKLTKTDLKSKYYFIFDNIYTENTFLKLKEKYENKEFTDKINKNFYFYFFVQLNGDTAQLLEKNENNFYFINNKNSIRPKDYIDSLFDENYEKNYFSNLKINFDKILSKYEGIDKFTKILKAKYLSKTKEYKTQKEIVEILKIFSEFFTIYCKNKSGNIIIENIEFINNKVKNFFNDQYNSILCEYINRNNLGIFDNIINTSIEGILLEKQIIFYLISTLFLRKIKIERIYCFDDDIKEEKITLNNNDNIIIIQKLDNSPIYDFAIITVLDNIPTLKNYQVGLNKDLIDLLKMDKDIINLDIEYFIKKIDKYLGIKIQQYSFGIITSKDGYDANKYKFENIENENKSKESKENDYIEISIDENLFGENCEKTYKNYIIMKDYCKDNFFEFIIFDKNNKNFYLHGEDNNLQAINFTQYKDEKFIIKIENIFDDKNFDELKKMYFNKNDCSYISEKIKVCKGDNLNIKLIGKFKTSENDIQFIRKNNLFLCWEDLKNNIFCIFINNKILNKIDIVNDLSFKAKSYYICNIDGINISEIENAKNAKILLPISNEKGIHIIFKKRNKNKNSLVGKKRKRKNTTETNNEEKDDNEDI